MAATAPVNVLGIFAHVDTTLRRHPRLRAKGFSDLKVYTPVPVEEIEDEMEQRPAALQGAAVQPSSAA